MGASYNFEYDTNISMQIEVQYNTINLYIASESQAANFERCCQMATAPSTQQATNTNLGEQSFICTILKVQSVMHASVPTT